MMSLAAVAACDGGASGDHEATAAGDTAGVPAARAPAPVEPPPGRTLGDRPAEPVPTAADSAAAAAQDVSPEWIQRSRTMQSYEDCMRGAREAPQEARAQLLRACANLPTAPDR